MRPVKANGSLRNRRKISGKCAVEKCRKIAGDAMGNARLRGEKLYV